MLMLKLISQFMYLQETLSKTFTSVKTDFLDRKFNVNYNNKHVIVKRQSLSKFLGR